MDTPSLVFKHGGYRRLKSFQLAQLCYDVTVRFCDRYIPLQSRTHDQMIQAARSGVQNIAEGSLDSATSKKTEIKLTQIARGSLGELRLDYEDFLRQRGLRLWSNDCPLRKELIDRRCSSADEVAVWIQAVYARQARETQDSGQIRAPAYSYPELAANSALVLVGVACFFLDRQVTALEQAFLEEGGFSERMYRQRQEQRSSDSQK